MQPWSAVVALVLFALGCANARADEPARRASHVRVPNIEDYQGAARGDAFVHDSQVVVRPELAPLTNRERPLRARPGDGRRREEAGRRSSTFRPDRLTQLQGNVSYFSVFSPNITPYKRATALDAVLVDARGTPYLGIADSELRAIDVRDAPSADNRLRDRFWGNVMLDFSEGDTLPLPAPGPEVRILSAETSPMAPLSFFRDGADNLFVHSLSPTARQVRLVYLVDVPRDAFGELGLNAQPDWRRPLPMPSSVRADALLFASELNIADGAGFNEVLTTLVEHFRSFEESAQPPPSTGRIYLDLARGMRGICRHRAYGFVITAQALGIPSRFIQNEAHAFVEVSRPDGRWLRIELGGAAVGLQAFGGESVPHHRPPEDELPRPEAFERARAEAQAAAPPRRRRTRVRQRQADAPMSLQQGNDSVPDAEPLPSAQAITFRLDGAPSEALRGSTVHFAGVASSADGPAAHARVEVWVRSEERAGTLLGVTVTDDAGRFAVDVAIPVELDVGDYELELISPAGDIAN